MNWIAQRFTEVVDKVESLFSSHSALADRVAALEAVVLVEPAAPVSPPAAE